MATSNKDLISKALANRMLACIKEYEAIKNKTSARFKTVREFCEYHQFSRQNFMKIYHRYKHDPCPESLLPQKRGPKYKTRRTDIEIERRVVEFREKGNNRYEIARMIARKDHVSISPSTVYNICKRRGLNRLNAQQRLEKRRIITEKAGELAHSDLHQLSKGILLDEPDKNFYILGILDDCTRTVWLELLRDKKALTTTFYSLHAIGCLNLEYGIQFKAMMTDNGSEFGSGASTKNKDTHPYEIFLREVGIAHRYIRAYRPQTNGKIERFWKTLKEELLDGAVFNNFEELKRELQGYSFYYNEYRPHGSLDGATPKETIDACN